MPNWKGADGGAASCLGAVDDLNGEPGAGVASCLGAEAAEAPKPLNGVECSVGLSNMDEPRPLDAGFCEGLAKSKVGALGAGDGAGESLCDDVAPLSLGYDTSSAGFEAGVAEAPNPPKAEV